jgi:adenylate kinase family enzyme
VKINVVGTSSSGKTTFSKDLSEILSIPHIEMDALFWGPYWEQTSYEEFCVKLRSAIKGESWILDGNYTRTTPIKWECVDIVIWLDFSFIRSLLQAIKRAIKRIIDREELWPGTGNIETLGALFTKESIVLYTIKKHRIVRVQYETYTESDYYPNIQFIRLRSPRKVEAFLTKVKKNKKLLFDIITK